MKNISIDNLKEIIKLISTEYNVQPQEDIDYLSAKDGFSILMSKIKPKSLVGLIGELTAKQTNRGYFSNIPIGTKFIVTEEHDDLPAYDLTGYFLYTIPKIYNETEAHFTGYIEKGSWKLVGTAEEYFNK